MWRYSLFVALLHNSGAGDEAHSAEAIGSLIERAGHEFRHVSIDDPGWQHALDRRYELVAIAGGDGTVGEVLTELGAASAGLVTILPLGSANNIASAFGLGERTPEELIAGWSDAKKHRYRLGLAEAPERREAFVETVGGGLFAESILRAAAVETGDADKVELGLRLLRELVDELPAHRWDVELDGVDHSGEFFGVEAMVIGDTGPKVPLTPAADPEDRLLDVVLIADRDRPQLAAYLDDRLSERRPGTLNLKTVRCTAAVLARPAEHSLRIDDTLWRDGGVDRGHVRATLVPRPIEVLVPR